MLSNNNGYVKCIEQATQSITITDFAIEIYLLLVLKMALVIQVSKADNKHDFEFVLRRYANKFISCRDSLM